MVTESSSNGVMDECSGKVQNASTYQLRTHENQTGHVRETSSNGVMEEGSGNIQRASTHAPSLIVMYLAVVEIHHWRAAACNKHAAALPNKEGQLHPTG